MVSPPGEVPDQPAVHRAKGQFASLGALARARRVVQQPGQLGARKVSVQHQAGLALNLRRVPLPAQLVTDARCAPVLPDNGGGHGLAGSAIPQHRGLALIGHPDSTDAAQGNPSFRQRFTGDRELGLPDLQGVVLDPPRLRENLTEFTLGRCNDPRFGVDHQRARTGGALV